MDQILLRFLINSKPVKQQLNFLMEG